MSIDISDIAIPNTNDTDYRCIINRIIKNKATNLMQNVILTEKSEAL